MDANRRTRTRHAQGALTFPEQFIENAASVRLATKRQELRSRIEQLADFPEIGSPNLPESVIHQYGSNVRKLVVSPFIVIYEVDEDGDAVNVLGLIHQRAAW